MKIVVETDIVRPWQIPATLTYVDPTLAKVRENRLQGRLMLREGVKDIGSNFYAGLTFGQVKTDRAAKHFRKQIHLTAGGPQFHLRVAARGDRQFHTAVAQPYF